ncbi:MAG: hypothetical protein HQ481_05410 [Alphaproteobacteria bacterium]|nr:hypothetical protein [Alphaproteobacteria bacterium]
MPLNPTIVFEHDGETIERVEDMPPIDEPGFRQLLDHWSALRDRAGGALPARADLDAIAFPKAMAFMWVYQRVQNDGRTRHLCRLAGEDVRLRYSGMIAGKYLDEFIPADILPLVEAHYRLLLDEGGIGWSQGTIYLQSIERAGSGERILLPMLDDDGRPNVIVGASRYQPWELDDGTEPEPELPSRVVRYVIPFAVYDRARRG